MTPNNMENIKTMTSNLQLTKLTTEMLQNTYGDCIGFNTMYTQFMRNHPEATITEICQQIQAVEWLDILGNLRFDTVKPKEAEHWNIPF